MEIALNIPNARVVLCKKLGKTDLEHQLIVPTNVLDEFPIEQGYEREFTALDKNNIRWEFVLTRRQTGPYAKPVLQKGAWHQFVVEHIVKGKDGLTGNDNEEYGVVFYIMNNQPNVMQVRGLRKNPSLVLKRKPVWEEV